jgi:hypothetical protein
MIKNIIIGILIIYSLVMTALFVGAITYPLRAIYWLNDGDIMLRLVDGRNMIILRPRKR